MNSTRSQDALVEDYLRRLERAGTPSSPSAGRSWSCRSATTSRRPGPPPGVPPTTALFGWLVFRFSRTRVEEKS